MTRLLFAAPARNFADARYDGFALRHARLVEHAAAQGLDVHLLALQPAGGALPWNPRFSRYSTYELHEPERRRSRRSALTGWQPPDAWQREARLLLGRIRPAATVTLGPWLDEEYSPFFDWGPSVHVFEEDLTRMFEIASQRRRAQALRRAGALMRRIRVPRPDAVVVISPSELRAARARYGRSTRYVCIPQTLDPTWPRVPGRTQGDELLCLSVLSEARNAETLVPLIECLARKQLPPSFRVRLASATGLHPTLQPALGHPWVIHDAAVTDAPQAYRRARMALVPAARATGVKATILQAWACGCPVAALEGSARTVGRHNRAAVLSASSPEALADVLLGVWDDPQRLERVVEAGHWALERDFSDESALAAWRRLLLEVASST